MDINGVNRSADGVPVTAAAVPTDQVVGKRELVQAVKALNASEMFGDRNEMEIAKDPQTNRLVVRMVNRDTKEVVSQIPPQYVLQLAEDFKQNKS
jgi:uncharacterized FlaG/YvyC family protein